MILGFPQTERPVEFTPRYDFHHRLFDGFGSGYVVFIQLKIWKRFPERHPSEIRQSKNVFNKTRFPKKPSDVIDGRD